MNKSWSDDAWADYMYWHDSGNKQMIKRINRILNDIDRHPFTGIGKPEPLKFELTGKWSRRINSEHRIIYRVEEDVIYIYAARSHY
ncbi:Txe/YoeB family addiction module toxin [Levilactobacillus wangkuiensis]|uniref:Txe/YoeB family addiction module toxin n=1 Tax=Levilactobacillus wangkuiensis TaxID=2799566 RepID=UPI00194205BC|nr:Txe/YoeB family addiction module toxin [Levilactobacillus wangkuiensis]